MILGRWSKSKSGDRRDVFRFLRIELCGQGEGGRSTMET